MKRLTRQRLLALFALVTAMAVYMQWGVGPVGRWFYTSRGGERAELAGQVESTREALSAMEVPDADLGEIQAGLATALAELKAEMGLLPGQLDSNAIIQDLLSVAGKTGVEVLPISVTPASVAKIGTHEYGLTKLTVTISGDYNSLTRFVGELEKGECGAVIVENLQVTFQEDSYPTGRFELAFYGQPLMVSEVQDEIR